MKNNSIGDNQQQLNEAEDSLGFFTGMFVAIILSLSMMAMCYLSFNLGKKNVEFNRHHANKKLQECLHQIVQNGDK